MDACSLKWEELLTLQMARSNNLISIHYNLVHLILTAKFDSAVQQYKEYYITMLLTTLSTYKMMAPTTATTNSTTVHSDSATTVDTQPFHVTSLSTFPPINVSNIILIIIPLVGVATILMTVGIVMVCVCANRQKGKSNSVSSVISQPQNQGIISLL